MSKFLQAATAVISVAETVLGNETFKSTFLGEYSDGSPRSLPDAVNGEVLSPKQKKKAKEARDKRNKKRKKKGPTKLKL